MPDTPAGRRRPERPSLDAAGGAQPEAVAARLKAARLRRGYATAKAAAQALGVKPVTIYAHESGQRGVPRLAAQTYAHGYGVSVSWLLYGEDEHDAESSEIMALTVRATLAEGRLRLIRETLRRLLTELDAGEG